MSYETNKMPDGGYGSKKSEMNYRSASENMYLAKCKAVFGNSLKAKGTSEGNKKVGGPMGSISNGIKKI